MSDGTMPNPNSFDYDEPQRGHVSLESWAGRTTHPVLVYGQTLKMYRCEYLDCALGHRKGQHALIPKYAVRFDEAR